MSYYDGFEPVNLLNCYVNLYENLRQLGELYKGKRENLTEWQEKCLEFHMEGYDLGEQIHDCYAEMGALLEQVKEE